MKTLKKLMALNAADPSARPDPSAKPGCRRNPVRPGVRVGQLPGKKKTYLKGWVV